MTNPPGKSNKPNLDPLIGAQVDNYRITSLIGVGGMARVYEAFDDQLGRRVALKLLTALHDTDEEGTQRFWREARTLASLEHPRIVTLFHIGEYEHAYYISMRYIDGSTLLTALKKLSGQKKFMEPARILAILGDVAEALDYAHSKGVIHRDIKPSNILLTEDGHAILTDFGLTMQSSEAPSTIGTAFGTPRYIAPEQAISSNRAVPQSDIYSLGIVLYEMMTGQTPFDNDSPMSLALSHITSTPPTPRSIRPDISPAVEAVILKSIEKDPQVRYQTAGEMVAALRAAFDPMTQPKVSPPARSRSRRGTVAAPARTVNTAPATIDLNGSASASSALAVVAPLSPALTNSGTILLPTDGQSRRRRSLRATLLRYSVVTFAILIAALIAIGAEVNLLMPRAVVAAEPTFTPIPPRLRLIYADDWFAIYNPTGKTVSLHGLTFVHGNGNDGHAAFDPAKFIPESAINALNDGQCLRIVYSATGALPSDLSAPYMCGPQTPPGLILDPNSRFWLPFGDKAAVFTVKRDQTIMQTCSTALNTCEVGLP